MITCYISHRTPRALTVCPTSRRNNVHHQDRATSSDRRACTCASRLPGRTAGAHNENTAGPLVLNRLAAITWNTPVHSFLTRYCSPRMNVMKEPEIYLVLAPKLVRSRHPLSLPLVTVPVSALSYSPLRTISMTASMLVLRCSCHIPAIICARQ